MATGGQVVSSSINVCAATPSLTVSPANGLPGTNFSVSFTGQFTHFGSTTLPVIGGQGVSLTNFTVTSLVSATGTLVIDPSAAPGTRKITFTTGGEIVNTYFNVGAASIVSIWPYHAPPSTTLDVAITGLNTHFTTGTTQVLFGPQITVNSITVTDATHLTANITTSYLNANVLTASPAGWQSVYVNTGTEQVLSSFTVDGPSFVSVTPSSAAQGSTANITITGSLTNWVQGTTEAILGAGVTVSNLVITSPTTATATIAVSPTAPVGGNSVVMITGSEIESGFGFSVTPSAAQILSVLPSGCSTINGVLTCNGVAVTSATLPWQVMQLQTSTLNIVGVGTHWLQGETSLSFGSGVAVDQLTITSPTTATVQITVLSSAPVGFAALTTFTDGENVTLQQAIDIEQGYPTLLATTPAGGEQGATMSLQVLGRYTHWQQGVTSAAFNQDITVNSITVVDSSSAIVNITVNPTANVDTYCLPTYPSNHTITITTGTEQVSLPGTFCVSQGAAQINSVAPLSGIQGSTETVTITGLATNFIAGVTRVSFSDPNFNVGVASVTSPTTLTVPIAITTSATTGFKTITVQTYGEVASKQYSFTVSPGVGTLTEANPNQAEQGVQNLDVTLTGQYTNFSSMSTATFGAGITVNSITYNSSTSLTANISIDPLSYTGIRTVTVTTPGVGCSILANTVNACHPGALTGSEIVSLNAFTIITGPAIISQVAPATGNQGQEVVFNITGSATHWAQNFTQFYIPGGGSDITINSVVINSATSATIDMNIAPTASLGPRSVFMVTTGEALTDRGAFVVTGGIPVITYLSPNNAPPGIRALEVTINGLSTTWDATTTLNFGPGVTVNSFQVDDNTHIEAVITVDVAAQLGYRTVIVQTGSQALTSNFLVQAPPPPPTPYVWYENPSSGIPGQTLTITFYGSNTQWDPNPTTGTVLTGFSPDITLNTFQVTSPTSAVANITISPNASASHSALTLSTSTASPQEVDQAQFNVVVAQPTLSIVDPGSAMQGAQNVTVNIIGQYTTFDASTSFQFGQGITAIGTPTILGPTIATQVISIDQLANTGSYSVTATTKDAPAGQQVVGGAGFTVTSSLALISAITPNTALQGQTIQVEVTGQNTHWSGATIFQFGAGITVTSTQINSQTDATLTLALPAMAPLGGTGVSARTVGETANIANGFVVQAGTPLLLSSGPSSVPQQGAAVFTILSQATNWSAANPPAVSYGPGITVTNVLVTGPTSMTVDGYVLPTTNTGYYNLTVSSGTQLLGINNAVYVSPGPAVINKVSPASAGQGATLTVTITGINTHWQQGVTQLNFPGVLVSGFTVNSPTSISANISVSNYATAGQVSVKATTLGEIATGTNVFTIVQTQPELLSVVSNSGAQGLTETVNITGAITHFDSSASIVSFGAGITVNSVTASSVTSLQANITVQPTTTTGYRNVSVTTGSEVVSLANVFQVTAGPAAISHLSPASGVQGSSVTILVTGGQTHFASGITTAVLGGGIPITGISVSSATQATVTVSIPNSTPGGAYNVSLITGGETATILGGFTVTAGTPQLSVVSPPTGNQGETNLKVGLTGLFTHFANGTSTASFGPGITVNSTTVSDATDAVADITVSQTAALGSRNVSVTTNSETASITGGFSVQAGVPQLLNAAPGSAQAGATANIVIEGEITSFLQGSSNVSFGSGITVNSVTVNSATQLTANITIAANANVGSRDITVTTNGQALTLSSGFNVTASIPVVTQINPNIGVQNSTVPVTITGQFTNWVSGTTNVSVGTGSSIVVTQVQVNGATSLTANLQIASDAALGPYDVTVTTGTEVETVPGGFTVQPTTISPPSLVSLSPGASASGMPINSNIIAVFSQPMNRGTINTATVLLYLTSNPNSGWISVPGTVQVDATGRVMTFTPTSQLAVNSTYNLQLTNSIQDATGNTFNSYNASLYTVFTANATPPTVIAANPPALSTVGTNVLIQLEFSTVMDQTTGAGMTVSTGGNKVAGTLGWNSNPNCCGAGWGGKGTILTFTPTAPLQSNTAYTVQYGTPLADTAGNSITPGSFTFTAGSGADTAANNTSINFTNDQTNVGTNFAPAAMFSKPINPIGVNTNTLLLYNADSGKYINGTVNLAGNGLSATFAPAVPLLPDTYYRIHMSWGPYDADGNNLNGIDAYFTTGDGADLTPPQVVSVFPANNAASVPLNAQVVVHFNSPIDPSTAGNAIQVTPAGGSRIAGTATLASDQVTLTFVPSANLQGNMQYAVQVSGYSDMVGNTGVTFNSSFTTLASLAPLNVSTGLDASGNLIATNNTADAHWVYIPQSTTPSETTFGCPAAIAGTGCTTGTAQALQTVGPGDSGWNGGWIANGPNSDWINIDPNSAAGNTYGLYYTTFNISGSMPANLCLVGSMGVGDNGLLAINGNPIMSNLSAEGSLAPLNISIPSNYLLSGTNTLSLGWGPINSSFQAFRLTGMIETCGASFTGGLSVTSATPANATTSVPTNSTIALNFNHPLDPVTVNSTSLPVWVGGNSNTVIAGSYQVTGSQVVFTPSSPLPINTQINVEACNGPYDTAGDSAGNCFTQLLTFTTGNTATVTAAPFQVIAFTPAANATNVGLRAPVVATFNRSFNPETVNQSNATSDAAVFSGDSQSPWCTSTSRSQDNTTLQFRCYPLPGSTIMTAMLNSNLQDWQGNGLANYSSQFTTSQTDANIYGSVVSVRPGNGSSGIGLNSPIVLYTNLPINSASANAGFQVAQNNVAVPGSVQVLNNGYTLEFTPSASWTPGTLIQWWTTGSLTDSTYNTPINTTSGYFYIAADTSTLTPTVQVMSPQSGSNIAPNSVFDIQFNTPLNPATVNNSTIHIYGYYGGSNVAGAYTMPQPNVVRIVPSGTLSADDYFILNVTAGLQSSTGVPANATNGNWNWYWHVLNSTPDTTLPAIVSAVPYNGATNVGVNAQPGVVINKAIDPVSINSNTFQVTNAGTPLAGSYWISSDDTRVEFVPNTPLPATANLIMTLNGVLDPVGNPVNFSSHFQTAAGPDVTQPTVVWTSVGSNGSIPINSSITVQFSESMDVSTLNSNNFHIYDTLLDAPVAATLTWSADQSVAYLVPSAPLAAGREYYLSVYGGTDLAGNSLQGVFFYFYADYTGASTAPTVIHFNPLSGATGLGTNAFVEAQFSAPIDPNTLSGVTLSAGGSTVQTTPSMSAGNTVVQLMPQVPLTPGATYVMTVAGVKDPAGNQVATATNSFTTGATYDISAATLVSSDPPNNSTVGTNVTPKLVFSKPLNPITVSNSTFRMYLNDTGQWIPLTVTPSANGLTVTLQPQIPLLPNTRYYVQACCGYQDEDGNNGNSVNLYFLTGNGAVTTGPTVTVSPINGATGIPLNTQVIVTVSAPMDPTSWTQSSIQVLDSGNNPVAGTVNQTNNQTLTFSPANPLSAGITYTVNVGSFTDANGNAVVPSSTTFTTGAAASTGGLTFTSSNIASDAKNVSATQPLILTFSQILDPATVNGNTLPVVNGGNSTYGLAGTYAVSGNQVTFTPASPYPAGATITVTGLGGLTDVLGDEFQNGNSQQLLYFTVTTGTPDTTPLQVVSVNPGSNSTNVRPDVSVSVTFNKSINPGTASYSHNAMLFAGQILQVNGSITMSADNRTLTFNIGALNTGTLYTISLPAGGVADMSGNALSSNFTSTFTTGTNPATGNGSVTSATPQTNATGIPADTLLTLYVNRQVNASTLTGNVSVTVNGQVYAGTVQSAASGYEVQFTPSVPFPSGATVQWFFTANVQDVDGNPFNASSGCFYTQAFVDPATAQPAIVAVSPASGSTNMPTNGEIDLLYSQPIDGTTLSGNVYFNTDTPVTITQPLPNLVRLTPNSALNSSSGYYVCSNGSVKDTNGVAAQSACWATFFNTARDPITTSGTVSIGPPNGSQNVGTNAFIRLQFSKPVDVTTVNSANVQVTTNNGNTTISGTWSYNYSNNDVVGVNFHPENPLPPTSPITVSVNGLLDYAGNPFTPASSTFTTAALPDFTPANVTLDFPWGQTGVGTNASFTCRYSKPMDPSSITSSGVYVYNSATNAHVPVSYIFSSDLMSVTMTPTLALNASTPYYYYCTGAIDLTGNQQYGSSVYFTTGSGPSSAGPVLLQANPPNGMTNVPLNANSGPWNSTSLELLFNEPIAGNSLGNIALTATPAVGGATTTVPITASPVNGNTIVTVQLPYALQPNTTYTYNVTGVTDYNGNPMAPVTSSFTTGSSYDWTNPTITSTSPANGTSLSSVPTTLSVTFSKAMDPVLIDSNHIYLQTHNAGTPVPTTITLSPDYLTATLTPTAPLAEGTIYDIVYSPNGWSLTDIAGNPETNYGVQSTFTTGTAAAVNGVCGTANGQSFFAIPTADLCSAGTASTVTNSGSWTWTCNGVYGGANASCSATVTVPVIVPVPSSADVLLSQVNWLTALPTGSALSPIDAAGSSFAVNSSGNILMSTQWGNQVLLINGQTAAVNVLGGYSNAGPVAIDSQNNLYVAGLNSNAVVKIPYNSGDYAPVSTPTISYMGLLSTPAPCTGSDTTECGFAWSADAGNNYLNSATNADHTGIVSMAFDAAGDLFYSMMNSNSIPDAIFECNASCLTGAGSPIMVYQEPQSFTPIQLNVGSLAVDPWGNLFFTDSALNSGGYSDSVYSNLNELPVSAGTGYGGMTTGFAAAPAILYTLTPRSPGNYDDEVDGVAVDPRGAVYFATQYDGVFAFPNNGGTLTAASVASSMYSISTQGSELLTLDAQGNAYVASYGTLFNTSGADNVGKITVNNLAVPTTHVGNSVTNSATLNPVTTLLNDGNCNTPQTVNFAAAEGGTPTTEFSAAATNSCASTLSGGSAFPTTITYTPAAGGIRSAILTASDSDGNTGTATVSGVAQVWIPQTIDFTAPTSPVIYGTGLIPLIASGGASGNPVIFSIVSGPGTINGSSVTVTGVGTIVIEADQAGNAVYTAAPPVQQSVTVNQASQAINFTAPTSPVTYGVGPIPLSATGGASGNPVIFSVASGPGNINGNTLYVTGAGTILINADQAGNADYAAAASVVRHTDKRLFRTA